MNFENPDECLEIVSEGLDKQERMIVMVARNRFAATRRTLLPLLNSRTDICGFRDIGSSYSYHFKNGSSIHIMCDSEPKSRIRGLRQHKNITIGEINQDVLELLSHAS